MLKSKKIIAGDNSFNVMADGDIKIYANAPTQLIDEKIEEQVERLRKLRFFPEFDSKRASLKLGNRIVEGDLSGGSSATKGLALAWCARVLAFSDEFEAAEEFLFFAQEISDLTENKIAEALIASKKGDRSSALQMLAKIDSSASRSAAFIIVSHHDGSEKALTWLSKAGYKAEDLDPDGKQILLQQQLILNRLDDTAQTIAKLSKEDFEQTPFLHYIVALAMLAPVVPLGYRALVLNQPPFNASRIPLASNPTALVARRQSHQHFLDAAKAADELGLVQAQRISDEYALWLELCDHEKITHGKERLESKLGDPSLALGFVHYAIQFDVKLDLESVEREIDKTITINGGSTRKAALARFAIALKQPSPADAVKYVDRYRDQFVPYIDEKIVRFYFVEMLSQAGFVDRANEVFNQLLEAGISDEEESNIRRIISDNQGNTNPIESLKAQYGETKALSDLINLVDKLEEDQSWDDLCEFGKFLFEETKSIEAAGRFANALSNAHKSADLISFLEKNDSLLPQSYDLHMLYAWGLYHEGMFLKSQRALDELSTCVEKDNDYRSLQVNIWIATGSWASLSKYIIDEHQDKSFRSPQNLINTAQLALQIGSPLAKELVEEAVARANDDPAILSSAYFIATSAGWEDNPDVNQWLQSAAELSDGKGPIQKFSLKDLVDQKPEWERQESKAWSFLSKGEAPIFMVAQSLNRSLVELTIFPALANLKETDPRRRRAIPAYSGKRLQSGFDVSDKVIAIDATALLTLSFLNILNVVLDTFKTIYIPHSTLGWLFQEQQKAKFHQPSRVADAHKVRNFLATDVLKKFSPSTVANSELSKQVGSDLAGLIAEAEKANDSKDTQHIVVRSAPVHRVSSLMEEEADLSEHFTVLSSCLAVVEKLRQKGQITASEENQARTYLNLRERPWPEQPDIVDGATLYLDDLSISYLLHLGLLGKLAAAGLKAVASPIEVSEADSLISYEQISNEVEEAIEGMRASLSSRIKSEHVRFGSLHNSKEFAEDSFLEHPSAGILGLASYCDIAIIDDRFFNQHANIGSGDEQASVLSTLDLLDALVESGTLTGGDRTEYRTRLRRAGYFFIPLMENELKCCLSKAVATDGNVAETAELKAIRESILQVRMSNWLQVPEEANWLEGSLRVLTMEIRNLWVDDGNFEEIIARADWLVKQVDIRGWAHRFISENADDIVRIGRASCILTLLIPPSNVKQGTLDAYWNWAEEAILAPIKEQHPEIYEWLVSFNRTQITDIIEGRLLEGDAS